MKKRDLRMFERRGERSGKESKNSEVDWKQLQSEGGNAKFQRNAMSPLGEGCQKGELYFVQKVRKEGEGNQWYELIGKQGS